MVRPVFAALLLTTCVEAQITLDVESLRTPIGMRFTLESITVPETLEASGFLVGPPGEDQTFAYTAPIDGPRMVLTATVIPLQETPDAELYAEADYAARYEIENPDGSMQEMYAYLQRGAQGDVLLAIEGPLPVTLPSTESTIPMPMTYGARWEGLETSLDSEAAPGIRIVGTMVQNGSIDGWGHITTPAGQFPYLRINSTATGGFTYEGNADLAALGRLEVTTTGISWNTHVLGTVMSLSQSTTRAESGSVPTTVSTSLMRVVEASGLPSVVTEIGWGQLKAMQWTTPGQLP